MKKRWMTVLIVCNIVLLAAVVVLITVVHLQGKELDAARMQQEKTVLFADDIGIYKITGKTITSVKLDSNDPTDSEVCEDVSLVLPLIEILENAVFIPTEEPKELSGFQMFYLEAKEGESYAFGTMDGVFAITINGERNYYLCSHRMAFAEAVVAFRKQLGDW